MRHYFSILFGCMISLSVMGQSQADTYIKEAQDLIAKKEYKQAQLSLQDAINELNRLIGEQIAESLPDEINGLKSEGEDNSGTAAMGMFGGGLQISKSYKNPTKEENEAELSIIANSPLLSSMSMYLSNPSIMGPDYKSVRIGTQRAILKSETDTYDDKTIRVSELQIPLSQTLITITLRGFASEADELAFANKLDLEKLKTALGE